MITGGEEGLAKAKLLEDCRALDPDPALKDPIAAGVRKVQRRTLFDQDVASFLQGSRISIRDPAARGLPPGRGEDLETESRSVMTSPTTSSSFRATTRRCLSTGGEALPWASSIRCSARSRWSS
mmetsp:Transcript_13703/g.43742  ORF Transcript_13703/g.43742 Transcript_13703/m.43742 type:complete len:124 (+) Transcript_13703:3-374(+)